MRQALQPLETLRVRKETLPEPRQCSPTMLKRGTAPAGARATCRGTSRTVSVGPAAKAEAGAASVATTTARTSFIRRESFTRARFGGKGRTPFAARIFTNCACVIRRAWIDARARGRCRGWHGEAARARDPIRPGPRGQPGHAGLSDEPALPRGERRLRRCRDPARHAGWPLDLDEDDLHGGAPCEAPRDRLRLARRRACRVGGRVDRPGGRRARNGADDEHRLLDPDRFERPKS